MKVIELINALHHFPEHAECVGDESHGGGVLIHLSGFFDGYISTANAEIEYMRPFPNDYLIPVSANVMQLGTIRYDLHRGLYEDLETGGEFVMNQAHFKLFQAFHDLYQKNEELLNSLEEAENDDNDGV
jgi:hypothetical protein